jgi:hypothetical protein
MTCYSGFEFSVQKRRSVFDDGVWRPQHEPRVKAIIQAALQSPCELRRLIADAGVLVGKPIPSTAIDLGSSNLVGVFVIFSI